MVDVQTTQHLSAAMHDLLHVIKSDLNMLLRRMRMYKNTQTRCQTGFNFFVQFLNFKFLFKMLAYIYSIFVVLKWRGCVYI